MYNTILKDTLSKGLFTAHQKVLIAVSGGIDSINLLQFLYQYQKELSISIGIAHINHGQRKESEKEEEYIRQWGQIHDVPVFISYFQGIFSEDRARNHRYNFFSKVMREEGYTALVTAHHADDQAETVFMRILRGSRLRYLSGIKQVSAFANGQLIRPFLPYKKELLPNIFHFEDASNASSDYLRNRIRNVYFPALERENNQLKDSLITLSEETECLFTALTDLTRSIEVTNCYDFLRQTHSVQEFLLQDYISKFPDLQVSKEQFRVILKLIRTKANIDYTIKSGYFLHKDYESFHITKIQPKTDSFKVKKRLELHNIQIFSQYLFSYGKFISQADITIPIYDTSPIILRRRKEGDRIFLGNHTKKIRRLFIDEKITLKDREEAVIGEQNKELIFVIVAGRTYLRKPSEHDIMKGKLYIENLEKR
ncbi:TPA: tRNA lysidine(34) synthetase TilS [Streptococcus agalactiae]|nr:tRNA lysidine(34) synthetase TilS [Streptococcus agalactiae]